MDLANMIFQSFGIKVSGRTVNRYRNLLHLEYKAPIRSVFLSEKAVEQRKNFTNFHLNNKTNWKNIVFSDESWFML